MAVIYLPSSSSTETKTAPASSSLVDTIQNGAAAAAAINNASRSRSSSADDDRSVSSSSQNSLISSSTNDGSSSSSSVDTTVPTQPLHKDGSGSTKRARRRRSQRNRNKQTPNSNQKPLPPISDAEKTRYLALDCEMVGVGEHGTISVVARVTVVNWDGHVVYDTLVQPSRPVTDYRTFVSGLTSQHDWDHAPSLADVRANLQALLCDKILVGHGLKNDLKALQLTHPWQYTRDTAKYEPFQKVRFADGVRWPRKLSELVREHLARDIQLSAHSPVEDAVAAMELYQKVRVLWEKVMDYKIRKTVEIETAQQKRSATE